jgi:hypothetical protein
MVHVDGEDAVESEVMEKEMMGEFEGKEGVKMFMISEFFFLKVRTRYCGWDKGAYWGYPVEVDQ